MRIKSVLSVGFLVTVLFLAAGIASCSNPDERSMDTFFPAFDNPLPTSPVGLVITDPVFRQIEPDPLTTEAYKAAALKPMTSADLWGYFNNASQRIAERKEKIRTSFGLCFGSRFLFTSQGNQ